MRGVTSGSDSTKSETRAIHRGSVRLVAGDVGTEGVGPGASKARRYDM